MNRLKNSRFTFTVTMIFLLLMSLACRAGGILEEVKSENPSPTPTGVVATPTAIPTVGVEKMEATPADTVEAEASPTATAVAAPTGKPSAVEEKIVPATTDTIESAEPTPDLASAVDLAPFVVNTAVDLKSWDEMGLEAYIELTLDSRKIQGINQDPDNFPTSRDVKKFLVIKPASIPVATVETALDERNHTLTLRIWLKKDIADRVVLFIDSGELETTQPDGPVTKGPFVVQIANVPAAPQVLAITDIAALAPVADTATANLSESADSNTPTPTTAEATTTLVSDTGDLPLYPILKGGKWGFINKAGQVVIKPQFDDVHAFTFPTFVEGLEPVQVGKYPNGKWGYIDRTGQFVIQPQFAYAVGFSEGLANFVIDGKTGYMDKTGKTIVEPQPFAKAFPFSEGMANFQLGNQWGFLDATGQVAIEPQFEEAWAFSEGLAAVKISNQWGYIDKTGQFIIQPQFDTFQNFSDGLAAVETGGRVQYINSSGQVILEPQLPGAKFSSFSEGLAAVKIGEKYGFIDKTGQIVIEPQFDQVTRFSEGLASIQIKSEGLSGYIDSKGQIVIKLQFNFPVDPNRSIILGDFSNGLAMIKVSGRYGYVDKSGNFVWEPTK